MVVELETCAEVAKFMCSEIWRKKVLQGILLFKKKKKVSMNIQYCLPYVSLNTELYMYV